jgi:hypothetical protein
MTLNLVKHRTRLHGMYLLRTGSDLPLLLPQYSGLHASGVLKEQSRLFRTVLTSSVCMSPDLTVQTDFDVRSCETPFS